MQLKLQRSQRPGGAFGGTVIFCLDARADYSPAEAADIRKYKLGGQVVYNSQAARRHLENSLHHLDRTNSSLAREQVTGLVRGAFSMALAKMSLNVSIASLGRGHHIECKDLPELLDAERTLMEACRNVKQFLTAAATFSGSIILVDFDDDERVHLSQGTLELAALPAPNPEQLPVVARDPSHEDLFAGPDSIGGLSRGLEALYRNHPKLAPITSAILGGIVVLGLFGISLWPLLIATLLVAGTTTWALRR